MLRRLYVIEHGLAFTHVANGILTVAGASCIFVLSNYLYHYLWVADRHFTSTAGVVWYVATPAALAFVCFGALRLTSTYKQWVSILCLALAVLVYAFEVVLEGTGRGEGGSLNQFAPADGERDPPDADQMVAELRSSGVSAVRSTGTPIAAYDKSAVVVSSDGQTRPRELMPLSGIARRPTVTCNNAGRWLVYDSDEHGFHNPLGLWKSNQLDIAAVGNSWTQGWCVPSDKNFVSLMRVRYPATLNLGMSGEGPLQILAITREYLSVLQPKMLIWFYFEGNSLRELQNEKKYEWLMRYLDSDFTQGLVGRQREIDQALSAAAEEQTAERKTQAAQKVDNAGLGALHRVVRLTSLRTSFGLVYGADAHERSALVDLQGPNMELFRQIVARVKSQVSSWGGTLVFAYLPSRERYPAWTRPALSVDSQQRARVLQVVAEASIPVIDLLPVLQTRGNSLFRQDRYNDEGHRLIAEHVLDVISSMGLNGRITRWVAPSGP